MQSSTLKKTIGLLSLIFAGAVVWGANNFPDLYTDQFHVTGATATTVPYFDANKKLVSSAATPTQLGLLATATSANTPTTLVERDGSGNFSAGIVTAALTGNVTGNLTGNVTGNVTGALTGNVTGNVTGNLTGNVTGNADTATSAAKWTTARNLAGNSVDGSANVVFANRFIVQGTTDAGLSTAQFLGALGTGIVKNTTTTGVLSIAVAGDFPTLNQNTSGTAASLSAILGLALGGTNADLSATGGTGQVLKQSAGHVISVAQLACADLSNSVASCSTDTTNAGNISAGTLSTTRGGSGISNPTIHDLLIGNGSSALTQLAPVAGTVLVATSASADPSFTVTPTLGVAATTAGTITLANATGAGTVSIATTSTPTTWTFVMPTTHGNSGQVLTSSGSDSVGMTWSSPAVNALTTTGDMPYASDNSGSNARLPIGSTGQGLSVVGGLPAWVTNTNSAELINCSITASVASSAMTVALKDSGGSNPSSSSPCRIAFRNVTLATGSLSEVITTGAVSVVVSNGSALGCVASSACSVWVYAINNAGTVELGVIGQNLLDEGALQTSTAEGGAGAADTGNTLYSTTARSSIAVRLLGHLIVTPGAAFAWTAAPTTIWSNNKEHFQNPSFRGTNTAGTSMTNNAVTDVPWTTDFDTSTPGGFSTPSYTVYMTGKWHVGANLQFPSSGTWNGSTSFQCYILKNGSIYSRGASWLNITAGGNGIVGCAVNGLVSAVVGDTIKIQVLQNSGAAKTLDTNTGANHLDIFRVSD